MKKCFYNLFFQALSIDCVLCRKLAWPPSEPLMSTSRNWPQWVLFPSEGGLFYPINPALRFSLGLFTPHVVTSSGVLVHCGVWPLQAGLWDQGLRRRAPLILWGTAGKSAATPCLHTATLLHHQPLQHSNGWQWCRQWVSGPLWFRFNVSLGDSASAAQRGPPVERVQWVKQRQWEGWALLQLRSRVTWGEEVQWIRLHFLLRVGSWESHWKKKILFTLHVANCIF